MHRRSILSRALKGEFPGVAEAGKRAGVRLFI
jgi:hypothetical protein